MDHHYYARKICCLMWSGTPALLVATMATSSLGAVTTITSAWSGGTVLPGDTVVIVNGGSVTGPIATNGVLNFAQTGSLPITNAITGSGAVLITNGGTTSLSGESASSTVILDFTTTVQGGVLEAGPGGWLDFSVGENATGVLNLAGGSVKDHYCFIGQFGSTGSASVSSGTFANSSDLFIGGYFGTGQLTLAGGSVTNDSAYLGYSNGSGSATVSGGEWVSANELRIGPDGHGTLRVEGGRVVAAFASLGIDAGGTGTATVRSGTWKTNGTLTIGGGGSGSVTVEGGYLNAGNTIFNAGHCLIRGGTWATSGWEFGTKSGTSELTVSGGYLSNNTAVLAASEGTSSMVTITNGTWANGQSLVFGQSGSANVFLNGGMITAAAVTLDGRASAMTIQGGTMAVQNNRLSVANTGSASLRVAGGLLSVSSDSFLGNEAGSFGTATVTSGTWTSQSVIVGSSGTGQLTLSGGVVGASSSIQVGQNAGSHGSLRVEAGEITAYELILGSNGSASFGMTGGRIQAQYAYVGASQTGSGRATCSDGTIQISGQLTIGSSGNGQWLMTGGTCSASTTIVGNGGGQAVQGSLEVRGGVLTTGALTLGYYGHGTLDISAGAVASTDAWIGRCGVSGTALVSGGQWISSGRLRVGDGGVGAFQLTGGAVATSGGSQVGSYSSETGVAGSGAVAQNGGTWNNTADLAVGFGGTGTFSCLEGKTTATSMAIGRPYMVSYGWNATYGISGTGAVLVAGGTVSVSGDLTIGSFEYFRNISNGNLGYYYSPGTLTIRDGGVVAVAATLLRNTSCGTIHLDRGGTLLIGSGTSTGYLNTDLVNNGHLVITNPSDLGHSYSLTGDGAFTKRGAGSLVMYSAFGCTGTTSVEQGTLRITMGNFASPAIVSAGASLQLDPSVTLRAPSITLMGGTLNCPAVIVSKSTGVGVLDVRSGQVAVNSAVSIADGGRLLLSNDTPSIMAVQSLAVSSSSGGYVDLGRGRITIAAGGISAVDLRANLVAGRADGTWTGTSGIASIAASTTSSRAVGYRVLANSSAIVAFAAFGDCTLDGQVNSADVNLINNAGLYGQGGTSATWWQGDFNYDGMVDILDISGFLSSGLYGAGPYNTAAAPLITITAVPEPRFYPIGGAGLTVAAAWFTATRSRRRLETASFRHAASDERWSPLSQQSAPRPPVAPAQLPTQRGPAVSPRSSRRRESGGSSSRL